MKLRQFVLSGVVGKFLSAVAFRKTEVSKATTGHAHRFFSFYLTRTLKLGTRSGLAIEASSTQQLILWIVPPGMFHEWVAQREPATVWDMTPLHRPHQLVT